MKLVVLTSRFPYPLEKGDKLRIYNQIKVLSKNHEIHLFATSFYEVAPEDRAQLQPFCKSIHVYKIGPIRQIINLCRTALSTLPFQVGLFYSKVFHKAIENEILKIGPDAIYCHLIRMSEYVKTLQRTNCPTTLDYMDVFSKGIERRANKSKSIFKPLLKIEHQRLLQYENEIFDKFSHLTIISEQDRAYIPHPQKSAIHIIENGVDYKEFYPVESEKKYDLLFTGNMGYPPNIEAAIFAAKKILPLVHIKHPSARLLIAGTSPTLAVRKLASEKVIVIDHFDHIRDAFASSRINLAPMLTSIGLQNKILQAMAMKMPTICTTLANNAVKAIPDEQIAVADEPETFALKINLLLTDSAYFNNMAEKGYAFVQNRFDWEKQNNSLEPLLFQKLK